ncbi:hypothetical protein Q8A67_019411 [Cirrhinus molitorella]|uniref:Uncharacterized protein n=1 Tax=Cirrhinus molitorella TaxID=172907 RepID=A0AA88TF24_9TELE|nr:hypothetical protein Q8A67_019411 [Cirrhinus molitorella]
MTFAVCLQLIYFTALPFLVSGELLKDKVHQVPKDKLVKIQEPVTLTCVNLVSISADYPLNVTMMIMFAIFFVMLPGLVQSYEVDQTPQDLMKNLTESAVVTCSHSIQGFDLILCNSLDSLQYECQHESCHHIQCYTDQFLRFFSQLQSRPVST